MTRLAVGFGRGFPRVWLVPIGALTVLLGVAASGRLSRSIVADLIAWWPAWIGLAAAAYLFRERKIGRLRVAGIVPLSAVVLVVLFAWGHLAGWAIMPSASQRLVGPEVGEFTDASLSAEIEGVVEVTGGSEFLYRVEPVMRGGGIGIPTAGEQVVDGSVDVVLQQPADPGLYTYAGWDISLADSPRWSLVLDGAIEADLSTLSVESLALDGSGTIRLGSVDAETPITVSGSFHFVVPEDIPVRVIGTAAVPASWALDQQGAVSPVLGEGWVITVGPGASLTVTGSRPSP
jgi:hypothetical protein